MGCAQAKHSVNSPAGGVEKLKLENGYAGISDFKSHRRSTGQRRIQKESDREDSHRGDAGVKNDGDGGHGRTASKKISLSKTVGDDELVDGWPKWLTNNIPKHVLAGLVPKSVEAYDKLDKVGQGSYSNVYKARDRGTGKIVALKKVRFDTSEPESVKFMAREIMILLKLDHPNIVKLEGLATSRMHFSLYLVFDLMQTDLSRIISRPYARLNEPQVKCYMHQLLSGLQHCHDKGILHRDIKGSNLLIDKNGMLKIADFGLANFFNPGSKRHLTNRVVTLWYRAPELLLGATDYGVGIDLWSAGCLLAEMFTGKPILPGRTEVEQLHKIFKLCGSPSEEYWRKLKLLPTFKPPQSYRPNLVESFKHLPSSSLGLLSTLLTLDPAYRGSASLALKNEFFYTSPLACDLSGLPVIPAKDDEINPTNQQKKSRNSKVTRRSQTNRERRRKDLMAEKQKDSTFPKEVRQKTSSANDQSEEAGSTATSTSSGVHIGGRKGSPHFLLSPIASSNKKSSRTQGHLEVSKNLNNLPPLPTSRRYSAFHVKDDNEHITSQVRRSVSTRDFRNFDRKEQLKFYAVDD